MRRRFVGNKSAAAARRDVQPVSRRTCLSEITNDDGSFRFFRDDPIASHISKEFNEIEEDGEDDDDNKEDPDFRQRGKTEIRGSDRSRRSCNSAKTSALRSFELSPQSKRLIYTNFPSFERDTETKDIFVEIFWFFSIPQKSDPALYWVSFRDDSGKQVHRKVKQSQLRSPVFAVTMKKLWENCGMVEMPHDTTHMAQNPPKKRFVLLPPKDKDDDDDDDVNDQ